MRHQLLHEIHAVIIGMTCSNNDDCDDDNNNKESEIIILLRVEIFVAVWLQHKMKYIINDKHISCSSTIDNKQMMPNL